MQREQGKRWVNEVFKPNPTLPSLLPVGNFYDCFVPIHPARVSALCCAVLCCAARGMRQHLPRGGGARSGRTGTARPFPVVLCRAGRVGSSPLSTHARSTLPAGRQALWQVDRRAGRQAGLPCGWVCTGPHACPIPTPAFPFRSDVVKWRVMIGRAGKSPCSGPRFSRWRWWGWAGKVDAVGWGFELAVWSGALVGG